MSENVERKVLFLDTIAILKRVLIREVGSSTSTSMYCYIYLFCKRFIFNPYSLASIPMFYDTIVISFVFCFSVYTLLPTTTYFDDCLQRLLLKYNSSFEVV